MKSNKPEKSNGFTMMEILVYVAILIIFVSISSRFIIQGLQSTTFGYEQDEAVSAGRKTLQTFIKEVRGAKESQAGSYCLESATAQELVFYSNVDGDLQTERVRYFVDGSLLKKGVIHATGSPVSYPSAEESITELSRYINNQTEPVFTYYDTDNALIADPAADIAEIRMIHISLRLNVTPERAPMDFYVETDAQIRNLKDNL